MNYMGIDHHKQSLHITMLNEKEKKLKSGRVANYRSEFKKSDKKGIRCTPYIKIGLFSRIIHIYCYVTFKNRHWKRKTGHNVSSCYRYPSKWYCQIFSLL